MERKDYFNYDAMGNRHGWNDIANRGHMLIQRRNNNGLNQYYDWANNLTGTQHWGSVTPYDDNFDANWQYPGNGVMMADGFIVASYNALNQPVAIWSPAYETPTRYVWFGHDPLGRCVKRAVGPVAENGSAPPPSTNPATYFYYDGWNLIQEGLSATNTQRVYVHGGRVDEIVHSKNYLTSERAYHQYDARGHCTLLTDTGGQILEQYEYDAFGWPYFYHPNGSPMTVNGKANSVFGNRFLFTGREWLSDLRLYDYRNRLYQPELGRFLQPDPKHFEAGDYNLYRYCHNDPINKTDPDGLAPGDPFGSPQDAARDAHSFINPTSIKQNAEHGSVIYKVGDKFYASPTFTNGAQTRVTLGNEVDKGKIPKEVRSQATRGGDYHSHGDYSKNLINPKDGTSKIVRASKSENPESDHPSPGDKQRAGIIQEKVPSYRLFLGTPSGAVKEYDSKKEKPL